MRTASAVLVGVLLTACAGGPSIRHRVLTPPPSAPRAEFFVEKPEVQSREVGADAWARNERYGDALDAALRQALSARGKTLVPPPADVIRTRVYLAYGPAPVRVKGKARRDPHIEVRLELVDVDDGAVRYSTHTQASLDPSLFARWLGGADAEQIIHEVLAAAAEDFAERL